MKLHSKVAQCCVEAQKEEVTISKTIASNFDALADSVGSREFDLHHGIVKPNRDSSLTNGVTEFAALKPTILIVEDDKAARESLRMVLEIYGYKVEEFASGEDLIARSALDSSVCVILDVNLPGASGLNILGKLRANGMSFPAVLVSGRATKEMRVQAAQLNALAFFEKPIDIDSLVIAIDSIGI